MRQEVVGPVVMRHRRVRVCTAGSVGGLLVALFALVGVTLAVSTPAWALSQRGHVFDAAGSFGTLGAGDGQLSSPGGVAVSEITGDVYVLDRGNDRVEQFGPNGEFIAVWGWGVEDGKNKYETCGGECKAGLAGIGHYQMNGSALAIAVDNSTNAADPSKGDVYVATEAGKVPGEESIDKFSANGERLETTSNIVWKEDGEREELEELAATETHGLALGPDGTVWLYYEEDIYGLSDGKLRNSKPPLEAELETGSEPSAGLAADSLGGFYVGHERQGRDLISYERPIVNDAGEAELESLTEEVDGESTAGVAVDLARGSVYLDNETSIAALEATGILIQRFGDEEFEGAPVLPQSSGIAVSAGARTVYASDAALGRVEVFAPEAPGAPTIESISAQGVSAGTAQLDATIDPRGAKEKTNYYFEYGAAPCTNGCTKVPGGAVGGEGFGDEGFGEDSSASVRLGTGTGEPLLPGTTYYYRAGAENAEHGRTVSTQEGVFSTPPATGPFLADERVWEMVSPPYKDGAAVEPLTKEGAAIQASVDGDALSYVANGPIGSAEGSRSLEVTQMIARRGSEAWASQDIVTPNEHGTGFAIGKAPEYQLFSSNLALGLVYPFSEGGGQFAEPPLAPPAAGAEEECSDEAKAQGITEACQEKTMYLRDDSGIAPAASEVEAYEAARRDGVRQGNPGYLALVTAANVSSDKAFGPRPGAFQVLSVAGATPDLTHVVLGSTVELTPGSASGPRNLYEWADGQLQLVNLLPGANTVPAEQALLGANGEDVNRAVSADGSRVIWSAVVKEGEIGVSHLYLRDMVRGETVRLDEVQGGSGEGPEDPVFQTASADGSRVFFTDTQRLTAHAGATTEVPDLYVFELTSAAGEPLRGRVTDLADPYQGEPANVQGLVLGASEDGATVYFVANGLLSGQAAEQAPSGDCVHTQETTLRGATCNLYVEHHDDQVGHEGWEAPELIATLSNEDRPDWEGMRLVRDLGEVTSRVSPDGRYLAFMSERSLTSFEGRPYDNRVTAAGGESAPAEEVYLYDFDTGRVVCASCDPSGARPEGVLDPPQSGVEGPEGLGLLADRATAWEGKWLAGSVPGWTKVDGKHALYQSRYLSDSGRLFFDSPDALVPQDRNGKEDVYEYEPRGIPRGRHECRSSAATYSERSQGCVGLISSGTSGRESTFLDASETGGEGEHGEALEEGGGDVFFVTTAKLVPQDTDESFDVYDTHECTDGSPCIVAKEGAVPPVCANVESCRPATASQSPGGDVATASEPGSGNIGGQQKVLGLTTRSHPKPLTRAQKLARALKACTKLKPKSKRAACDVRARRRYGPLKAKKSVAHRARALRRGSR